MGAHGRHFTDLIFLTDFDGTCSLEDTTDVLAQLAPHPNNACCYLKLLHILSQNIRDCLSFQIPHTCAFHWDSHHSSLRNLLRKLEDFEKDFNQKVIHQQLLKGICRKEIKVAAKKVPLRAGCIEFLVKLAASNTPIHVISANWSKDMIQTALPNIPSNFFSIHSCDLTYENEVCDGNMELQIQDAFDKEVISEEIYFLKQKKMVVYIGDSMNDILPMLGADLGIIIDTNKTLKKILSLFKIQVDPLEVAATEIRSKKATSFRHTGRLFKVAAWAEVEACLSKLLPW